VNDPTDDRADPHQTGLDRRQQRSEEAAGAGGLAVAEADADDDVAATTVPSVKSSARNGVEWVAVILGAVIIAVIIRTFILQTFWIPSPSMSTTLVVNDRVLVNKLSYRMHGIHRGDVVVFKRPADEPASDVKDLIKRVIGLPGEHISITDGKVHINGRALKEPYTNNLDSIYSVCGAGVVTGIDTADGLTIPKDHVFVMGDNRTNSHDSRCFGPIPENIVVGRAFAIIWPPSKIGGL